MLMTTENRLESSASRVRISSSDSYYFRHFLLGIFLPFGLPFILTDSHRLPSKQFYIGFAPSLV
jgi:hypothetical protein